MAAPATTQVLTLANLLSVLRLLCVPLFLWLLLGTDSRTGAALLLGGLGATDWVDGYVARRFGQVTELGKLLDPTADRILVGAAVVALAVDGSIPAVVLWPVVVREVVVSVAALVLRAIGARPIEVLWLGKAGTFALMFAFPLFLLGESGPGGEDLFRALGWAAGVGGVVLGYAAAWQYARRVPGALEARPARRPVRGGEVRP